MVAVPAVTPPTIPFTGLAVATLVLLLLHTPPTEASCRVVVPDAHTVAEPVMATRAGNVSTVTVVVVYELPQDIFNVYVMIVEPVETPLTLPVAEFTVAMPVLSLLHAPPGVASLSVVTPHTCVLPVIATGGAGVDITVTLAVSNAVPQLFPVV